MFCGSGHDGGFPSIGRSVAARGSEPLAVVATHGMAQLTAFAYEEFRRLEGGYDAGTFVGSVNQVLRYWDFLQQICVQHAKTTATYRAVHEKVMGEARRAKAGEVRPLSTAQQKMFALFPCLDLEVQSFYLFAKIMLGAVAQVIAHYFGGAPRCRLDSHDKFRKSFAIYQQAKMLIVPDGFIGMLASLQERIVDHRDKQYEHFNPLHRPHLTTSFQIAEGGELLVGQMPAAYPDLRQPLEVVNSEPLPELLQRLSSYLTEVTRLLENNRSRTRLQPNRQNPGIETAKTPSPSQVPF
jgi:hypothetical protein